MFSQFHRYFLNHLLKQKFIFFQRNGADFSLFLYTASEFDGSDSGARPDEAVSWGKIRMDATPVKVRAKLLNEIEGDRNATHWYKFAGLW